ncbi:MAG: hypothetical protein CVV39_05425 [Planctomycetes bacterium HGW-Planctomycetes-1]|nr:MAG: hypothetical protein CVV39_05425 [Planctomycetes bacterium HGW-Planctomycetes-1]
MIELLENTKNQLGQFFTENCDYILNGFEKYVIGKNIVDPFAGGKDLITWARKNNAKSVIGYDIDKSYADGEDVFLGDSLLEKRKYEFVLTNPPYLNVNKADEILKERYYRKFDFEDLYQISLFSIIDSNEGIVIVPINFLSAENSAKLRKIFFEKFEIVQMNYFRHQVFPDTTYNVISFYYRKKEKKDTDSLEIATRIYPEKHDVNIRLERKYDWTIGGRFLKEIKTQSNLLGIYRLLEEHIKQGKHEVSVVFNHLKNREQISVDNETLELIRKNILLLKAIDTGTEDGKICIENIKDYGVEALVSKTTSRNQIYLVFKNTISIDEQKKLIGLFNEKINEMRKKYLSLFMTNFRDKDRKRISFDFAYKLLNYLYYTKLKERKVARQPELF